MPCPPPVSCYADKTRHKTVLSPFVAILQISPDFPVHQKKSGGQYIWVVVVVVVVVVVCMRRLGTRTNMSATKVEQSTDLL